MVDSFACVLIFFLVRGSLQQTDWCSLKCIRRGVTYENTMCIYKQEKDKNECKDQVDAMTDTAKKRLLGLHNYVRDEIAAGNVQNWPAAADMRQITWDDVCSEVALMWAFQCIEEHDKCRRTPTFEKVGQNLGFGWNTAGTPEGVFTSFKGWLVEIELISSPKSIIENFVFHSKYGHYTALVWSTTYKMGCAIVNSTFTKGGRVYYKFVVACNYAPAGNTAEGTMYKIGDPCTGCSAGTACNPKSTYKNLCAAPGDPSDEKPEPTYIPQPATSPTTAPAPTTSPEPTPAHGPRRFAPHLITLAAALASSEMT